MNSLNNLVEIARRFWPILNDIEFTFYEGEGETHFGYGVLGDRLRIVRVTQLIPPNASEEKKLSQLAQDIAYVLNKDFQTVLEALQQS